MTLKKTPLDAVHRRLGAKMGAFAGWELPLWYPPGQTAEHFATRRACGLFDISHMGEFEIRGGEALSFLSGLLTNDVGRMEDGQAMYQFLLNPEGGVIDDCILYRFDAHRWMLVVNAANISVDLAWLKAHAPSGVTILDKSDETAKIDLQGPQAPRLLARWVGKETLSGLRFFHFLPCVEIDGISVLVSRTGYTGEIGFELYLPADRAVSLWTLLFEEGQKVGLLPCGLGARDSLRLEAGLPLHGHELTPDRVGYGHPWEFVFHWDKPFIGREAVLRKKERGEGPFVLPFRMHGRRKAMPGWEVIHQDRVVGHVTSAVIAPSLQNTPIGFLTCETRLPPGSLLTFRMEGRPDALAGEIATCPFLTLTSRKKIDFFL